MNKLSTFSIALAAAVASVGVSANAFAETIAIEGFSIDTASLTPNATTQQQLVAYLSAAQNPGDISAIINASLQGGFSYMNLASALGTASVTSLQPGLILNAFSQMKAEAQQTNYAQADNLDSAYTTSKKTATAVASNSYNNLGPVKSSFSGMTGGTQTGGGTGAGASSNVNN